jgi:ligand-binding SRPBCC domain-containing protein
VIVESSVLPVEPERAWAHATSMAGVNAELRPLVRMTAPREARGKTIVDVPVGERAFTSVILAGGLVPIDLHFLTLESAGEREFQEASSSLLWRSWRHRRTVEPAPGGCVLTDRVAFTSRVPGIARLATPLVRAVFRHRHRRLRALFSARS